MGFVGYLRVMDLINAARMMEHTHIKKKKTHKASFSATGRHFLSGY
jgi:hypothetical protein